MGREGRRWMGDEGGVRASESERERGVRETQRKRQAPGRMEGGGGGKDAAAGS